MRPLCEAETKGINGPVAAARVHHSQCLLLGRPIGPFAKKTNPESHLRFAILF
jgi:hypothetical protein